MKRLRVRRLELQLLLIRVCAGLAFLPHAAPKLFEGFVVRERIAQQIAGVGLPHALQFVVLAGVIELVLGLTLTLGWVMRAAAVLAAVYLGVLAYFLPEEHALLWLVVCVSFAIAGGGRWSVDGWLGSNSVAAVTVA